MEVEEVDMEVEEVKGGGGNGGDGGGGCAPLPHSNEKVIRVLLLECK